MEAIVGEWVLEENENFDGMLKELGVNAIERAIAVRLTTYAEIRKKTDDEYELKTVTGPVRKTRQMKFGVEFEDDAPTGGKMSGSWKLENGRMVGTFFFNKDKRKMTIERYNEDDKLIEIMTVGKESSKRTFKRKK
ncbi:fatty acid-binding protein homolog 6-like [Styela clava]